MSSLAINHYKADLRDFYFLLFEQFGLQELLQQAPFDAWGEDEVRLALSECYKFVCEVLGPLNGPADASGCRVENGGVKTPAGFAEAWRKLYEAGWKGRARRRRCSSWSKSCCRARTRPSTCTPA
jgi:hypothetical protein